MQSIKSRLINFLLRNRHIINGRFRKEKFDMSTSIEGFRRQCEKGAARFAKIPDSVDIQATSIAGFRAEWIIPQGSPDEKLIFYVHGGGYVSGSCSDHRAFVSKFAKHCGYKTLTYEYRLAPEFPFPYAIDDSMAVYTAILEMGFEPSNIIFAGESAGGGLALALLLALKSKGLAQPKAAVAISPWTDLSCSSPSYLTKNERSLAPLDSWIVFSKHYCGVNNPKNPLISPLFGDLTGLPPIFINAGTDDELFDDGERFYLKAKEAGVDARFKRGESMVHCYPLFSPIFREAKEAMDEIVEFVGEQLG